MDFITGETPTVSEEAPKRYGLLGLSWEASVGGSGCSCQYQNQAPTKRPTQNVTEKIIKIQGVNATPTQRKKKKPAVNASLRGESMRTVIALQGGKWA